MSILEKMLMSNPQIKQLMNKGVDPRQLVLSLAKQGKVDINQLEAMANKYGYKIPKEIINDIKSQGSSTKRF